MEQTRRLEPEALKALAHPLRVRLFSELTSQGPATASVLADRLGESSGATSYHLRQLERHGFVREDESRGNARDRWWERVPGPIEFSDAILASTPGARSAGELVEAEFVRLENQRFAEYWRSRPGLPADWLRAVQTGSAAIELTADELAALGEEVWAIFARHRDRPVSPGARRVDLQFRGFPLAPAEDAP